MPVGLASQALPGTRLSLHSSTWDDDCVPPQPSTLEAELAPQLWSYKSWSAHWHTVCKVSQLSRFLFESRFHVPFFRRCYLQLKKWRKVPLESRMSTQIICSFSVDIFFILPLLICYAIMDYAVILFMFWIIIRICRTHYFKLIA